VKSKRGRPKIKDKRRGINVCLNDAELQVANESAARHGMGISENFRRLLIEEQGLKDDGK
jgi:hypothetical protein